MRTPPSVQKPVGRNDICPCGSGKKFKKCCLPYGNNCRQLIEWLKKFDEKPEMDYAKIPSNEMDKDMQDALTERMAKVWKERFGADTAPSFLQRYIVEEIAASV